MSASNALEAASTTGLTAQRLIGLDPEYRSLLMEGVRDLWAAERAVTDTTDVVTALKLRLRDAKDAQVWAIRHRDRIRRDISGLLPELEALQESNRGGKRD